MTAMDKSKDRRRVFWVSFIYIVVVGLVLTVAGILKYDIESAKSVYMTTSGMLTSLGIANYFSTPKESV